MEKILHQSIEAFSAMAERIGKLFYREVDNDNGILLQWEEGKLEVGRREVGGERMQQLSERADRYLIRVAKIVNHKDRR